MIFVTVGSADPFDRLVVAASALAQTHRVVVQRGNSGVCPVGVELHDFLAYQRVAEFMAEAEYVICHAGVGSILTALLQGRKPIVVPRVAGFGEAVDNHQLAFARRLASEGLVTLVENVTELSAVVRRAEGRIAPVLFENRLAVELREYLVSQGIKPVGAGV